MKTDPRSGTCLNTARLPRVPTALLALSLTAIAPLSAARADGPPPPLPMTAAPQGFTPPPESGPPPGYAPANPPALYPAPNTGAGPIAWKPGDAPPPGYRVSEKRQWPFVAGLSVFLSSWGLSALIGGLALGVGTNKAAAGVFIIPVVGPFIDLGWQKMTTSDAVFTGVIGGIQTLGAASLIAGLVLPKNQRLVPATASLQIAPLVTPTVQGVAFTGSF